MALVGPRKWSTVTVVKTNTAMGEHPGRTKAVGHNPLDRIRTATPSPYNHLAHLPANFYPSTLSLIALTLSILKPLISIPAMPGERNVGKAGLRRTLPTFKSSNVSNMTIVPRLH